MIFPDQWVLHISAMTAGLVVGKVSHFVAAAKGAEAVSRRRARGERPRRPRGPVRARLARWSAAMLDVLDRPRLGPLVLLAGSAVGFPPLAVVTVAAGLKRVPLTMFVSVTTVGCLGRFLVTGLVVAVAAG